MKRTRVLVVVAAGAAAAALGCHRGEPSPAAGEPATRAAAPRDAAGALVAEVPADARPRPPVKASPPVDTTTGASPTWTAGPAVETARDGAVDGAALRARNRARLAADHAPVTVLRGDGARDLGRRICEAVVPARPKDTPILIKPNLGGIDWFKNPKANHGDDGVRGRTTDPDFVRGVIDCLQARGHTAITVADGFTGKAADWDRLVRVSGYAAMAADAGVKLVAFDDDGVFDQGDDAPGRPRAITGMERTHVPTLLVPNVYAEHLAHGMIISVPKIKTHRFAAFSLGIKAMQGSTMYADASPAFHQKWRSHKEIGAALELVKRGDPNARGAYVRALELFAERMVDVLEVEAPDVVLAEGAPAENGDGFEKLIPVPEHVAIGGTNVILVDRVGAAFLGLWDSDALARELGGHRTSPLLEAAAARFGVDVRNPDVTGDGAALVAARRPAHLIGMAGFTIDDDAPAVASAGPTPAPAPGDGAPAPAPADGAAAPPPAATHLHATHIAAADAPRGVADEIWDKAEPLRFTTDWSGRDTGTATEVRALWSEQALYLRWDLAGAGLHTDTSRPADVERVDLYEEDCVEAFITPDPAQPKRYFEIEVGPYGHWFDIAVDRSGARGAVRADNAWSAGLTIATARDADHHTAVIAYAISAPAIVGALRPGASLPIGLDRMEGTPPRLYLAAFPTRTPKPNFHVTEKFGALLLDP